MPQEVPLNIVGIETKRTKDKNNRIKCRKIIYIDVKTRKRINDNEVSKRIYNNQIHEHISFYKENFELYASEYDKIMQVMKKREMIF